MKLPKVIDPPKEIWLVYGEIDFDVKSRDCDEVTWCEDQQFGSDVKYIRADRVKPGGLKDED